MTTSGTLKILATLVALMTTGGGMIWYASAKSSMIDQQEKHLEYSDARITALEARIYAMSLDIVRLQDRNH